MNTDKIQDRAMNVFRSISVHQYYQWLLKMKAYRLKPWLITVPLERVFEDVYKAMAGKPVLHSM